MNDFTASNGVRITVDNDGDYVFHGGDAMHYVTRGGRNEQAFREMVQAEADERYGKWRSRFHPDCFAVWAYVGETIHVCSDKYPAAGSAKWTFDRASSIDGDTIEHEVAREFFAAHPETKPWRDAKPGDVWRFETPDDRRHALGWVAQDGTWDLMTPRGENVREVVEPVAWLVENWGDEFEGAKATRFAPEVPS